MFTAAAAARSTGGTGTRSAGVVGATAPSFHRPNRVKDALQVFGPAKFALQTNRLAPHTVDRFKGLTAFITFIIVKRHLKSC